MEVRVVEGRNLRFVGPTKRRESSLASLARFVGLDSVDAKLREFPADWTLSPYVKLRLDKEVFVTQIQSGDHPTWNKLWYPFKSRGCGKLHVELWNFNKKEDEKVGETVHNVKGAPTFDGWVALRNAAGDEVGEIHLLVRDAVDHAAELPGATEPALQSAHSTNQVPFQRQQQPQQPHTPQLPQPPQQQPQPQLSPAKPSPTKPHGGLEQTAEFFWVQGNKKAATAMFIESAEAARSAGNIQGCVAKYRALVTRLFPTHPETPDGLAELSDPAMLEALRRYLRASTGQGSTRESVSFLHSLSKGRPKTITELDQILTDLGYAAVAEQLFELSHAPPPGRNH